MNNLDEKIITEADFLSNFLDSLDQPLAEMTVEQLRGLLNVAPLALHKMLFALIEFKDKSRSAVSAADRITRAAHGDWAEHAERMLIEYFWGLLIGVPMREEARRQIAAWATAAPVPACGWILTEILREQQSAPPPPPSPSKAPRGPGF